MNTSNSAGEKSPAAALCALDIQQVLHWNQERRPQADPFLMAVQDERRTSGQLTIDLGPSSGEIEEVLSASFEVADIPGTSTEASCMHVHLGDHKALTLFKTGDKYLLRPERGVVIRPYQAADGEPTFVLEMAPEASTALADALENAR